VTKPLSGLEYSERDGDDRPDIFSALQRQLGLKLPSKPPSKRCSSITLSRQAPTKLPANGPWELSGAGAKIFLRQTLPDATTYEHDLFSP